MNFVLGHQPEPLPECDGARVNGGAFHLQVVVGEAAENFHGFIVEAIQVGECRVVSVGQFAAMARIAAGLEASVFRPHVPLDSGEVAQQVAQSETAGLEGPFEFFGRDALGDADGAGADFFKIVEELSVLGIGVHLDPGLR